MELKKLKAIRQKSDLFDYVRELYQCESYQIEVVRHEYVDGTSEVHRINAVSVACESYYPNIWYDDCSRCGIEIQTASYGYLSEEKFDTFIKQQQEAREIAKYLKSYFLEERE